ncbi:MAG TPA: glycine cleavage system protein GcvH [Candidatus Methylomirabilis sp.]|nr:glycine cleavage system protein GcvH [Candidatus Methylomirabilis sp.]
MKAEELRYSKDHMWVVVEGDLARMGITEHAQRELGEVVFLDLPEVGRKCAQGEVVGSIESVKTTNDLFTPLSGEVVESNSVVRDSPNIVNTDPLGQGWLFRIRLSGPDELKQLLDFKAYTEFVKS